MYLQKVRNKQKPFLKSLFLLASCQPLTKKPDPYQNVTDPQNCTIKLQKYRTGIHMTKFFAKIVYLHIFGYFYETE
jgi:hypothetical protein